MNRSRKDWDARLIQNAGRTTVRHRNRAAVFGLTTLTAVLAIMGLVADLRLGSSRLAYGCYAAALASGTIVLAFLFSKGLRVRRRP